MEPGQIGPEGQPGLRGAANPTGLLRVDRLEGIAVAGAASRLHLTDDDRSATTYDEVELVAARARVRGENAVAAEPIVTADAPLGLRPEPLR